MIDDLNLGGVSLPPPVAEQERAAEEEERLKTNVFQGVVDAAGRDWITSHLWRSAFSGGYEPDPNFAPTAEDWMSLQAGLPNHLTDFSDAVSMDHALEIRSQRLKMLRQEQRLERLGGGGIALRMLVGMADPVEAVAAIGAGFVSGGAGTAFAAGQKVARASQLARLAMKTRRLRAAVGGAIGATASESALNFMDPLSDGMDVEDYVITTAAGATFGLGGEKLHRLMNMREYTKATQIMERRAKASAIRKYAMGAAAAGEELDGRPLTLDEALERRIITEEDKALVDVDEAESYARMESYLRHVPGLGEDPIVDEMVDRIRDRLKPSVFLDRLDQNGVDNVLQTVEDFAGSRGHTAGGIVTDIPIGRHSAFGKARIGMANMLGLNKSDEVRMFNELVFEDVLMSAEGATQTGALETQVGHRVMAHYSIYKNAAHAGGMEYHKHVGGGFLQKGKNQREFNKAVADTVRFGEKSAYYDLPGVAKAAEAFRRLTKTELEYAKEHGVRGLEDVEWTPNYFPRIWSAGRIRGAIDEYGMDNVRELIRSSMFDGKELTDGMTPAKQDRIADKVLDTLLKSDRYDDTFKGMMFSGHMRDQFRELLGEVDGLDPKDIEFLVSEVSPTQADVLTSRARHRMRLDEDASISTEDGRQLRLVELFENDADHIAERYVRSMVGASAATKLFERMSQMTGKEIRTKADMRKVLEDSMVDAGVDERSKLRALRAADIGMNHIMGHPINPDSTHNSVLRQLRALAYARVAPAFGVAQVPEFGNAVNFGLGRLMLQRVPEMKAMFKRARETGNIDSQFYAYLEAMDGYGSDFFQGRGNARVEIVDELGATGRTAAETRRDNRLHSLTRFSSMLGGQAQIDAFQRRGFAAAAYDSLLQQAMRTKEPPDTWLNKRGLTRSRWNRIRAALNNELDNGGVTYDKGVWGPKVAGIQPDKWADQEALSMLSATVNRMTDSGVQRVSMGSTPLWATGPLGRTVTQFRSFYLTAWEKQFLSRVQHHDAAAFTSMVTAMFLGSMSYGVQTWVRAKGRDDEEEYLNERLSTSSLIRAGIQRGGTLSMAPQLFDTMYSLGSEDNDTLFGMYRNTRASTNMLSMDSVPVASLINDAWSTVAGTVSGVVPGTDEVYSRSDMERWWSLTGLRHVLGVQNVLREISETFPEEYEEED